jgi:hypothetical protein
MAVCARPIFDHSDTPKLFFPMFAEQALWEVEARAGVEGTTTVTLPVGQFRREEAGGPADDPAAEDACEAETALEELHRQL